MKNKIIYLMFCCVMIVGILIAMKLPNTNVAETKNNIQQEVVNKVANLKGNFTELVKSKSSAGIASLKLDDTKETVTKALALKPIKSGKIASNDYDYYERYKLKDGKTYDIYYKANKLIGATSF